MAEADWFADESLWTSLYPFIFGSEKEEAARPEAGAVLALSGLRPASLLDLACGPGRHSVVFARLGIAVTGVDRSPFLLSKARERAAAEGVAVEWVQADMRDFVRPGAFDLAVNLYTSFGYFDEPADNLRVAANLHASLRPGGALVMDLVGKEVAARVFRESAAQALEGSGLFVQRCRVVDDWRRMENEWTVVRDGVVRSFAFRHWIYSGQELRELLTAAGFGTVDLFGGLDGASYGSDATRLVAVARKP